MSKEVKLLTPERKVELRKTLAKMTVCSAFVEPQQAMLDALALVEETLDAYDGLEALGILRSIQKMAELIQGLHVDVQGTELKTMLQGRLGYHQERATFYTKQLETMRGVDAALNDEAERIGKGSSTRGPLDSLEQGIKKHKDQAVYYSFMAAHVNTVATYRLSEHDLTRLGIQVPGNF